MLSQPIVIVFYDENDEETARYERRRIPAYLLETAIDLQTTLATAQDQEDVTGKSIVAPIFEFVVQFFGNRFTADDLKQHSDLNECMNVLTAVINSATQSALQYAKSNPTPPSPKKR